MDINEIKLLDIVNVDSEVAIEVQKNIHGGKTLYIHVDGITVLRCRVTPRQSIDRGVDTNHNPVISLTDETNSVTIIK